MRMGKQEKPRRDEKRPPRADAKGIPKYAARASVVGQVSSDIVNTYFAPELLERAGDVLENYSDMLLQYNVDSRDAGTDQDEKAQFPTPPQPPLYRSQYWVDQLEITLNETSQHFQGKNGAWKVQANAARFERRMDEKYGMLRPFLKEYPELEQLVRSLQLKYASGYFSPLRQGDPPIPTGTAVIILFMMKRGNVHWQVLLLSSLFFLVGLQPWALVVMVSGAHMFLENRKKRPRRPMKASIPSVEPYYAVGFASSNGFVEADQDSRTEHLLQPVGEALGEKEEIDGSQYDTILLGHGPATLYTAALLSRSGRKVLVLSSRPDASGCCTIEGGDADVMKLFDGVAFDIDQSNISNISRQQALLAPALATTSDPQGGVRFAPIGSTADGHAFEILSVPGMGAEAGGASTPFVLRAAGSSSLMEDAAMALGDGWPGLQGDLGSSATGLYLATCNAVNSTSQQFYLTKLLSDRVNGMRGSCTYHESSIRYASAFLNKGFPLNPHARSLLAAVGLRGENLKPSMASMGAHVSNVCAATSGEGMHYPVGGPRALCHAFAAVIEQHGGRIVTKVPAPYLLFEKEAGTQASTADNAETAATPPRCIGIGLPHNRSITVDPSRWTSEGHSPAVISMHGFVTTFVRLLPEAIRAKYNVPRGLPALSERRPLFKVLFALDGSSRSLDITGADFYRVPNAALAQDEVNSVTGLVKHGEIGRVRGEDTVTNDGEAVSGTAINEDNRNGPQERAPRGKRDSATSHPKPTRKKAMKFETGQSWMHIAFPSAKDPSFESRHGQVSTCVVSVEADDDFVTAFDTKPRLYAVHRGKESSGDQERLVARVRNDLLQTYPQLEGKILHSQVVGPVYGGLSHTPERFAAKGVRPESPYPGLFVGGSDLTVESFSGSIVGGWMTANAVMGYGAIDYLMLQKTITSDIARFLEPPDIGEDEDVAVPFPHNAQDEETSQVEAE